MKSCCVQCLQSKEEKYFSLWMMNTSKPKRCNSCKNSATTKRMIEHQEQERKIKRKLNEAGLTSAQIDYSKSDGAVARLAARYAIEDAEDMKRINEEIGI